tara:strand:- start:403 stop:627 length:225 start_codon:yes stop_codon:yes gene_type:complete
MSHGASFSGEPKSMNVFRWHGLVPASMGGTPAVTTSFIGELEDRSLAMIGGQAEVTRSRLEDRQLLAATAFYAR